MEFEEQVERLTEEDDSTVNEGVPNQQIPSDELREKEIINGEKGELKVSNNIYVCLMTSGFVVNFFHVKFQQMPYELDLN